MGTLPPNTILFYDEQKNCFVSPLNVETVLERNGYTLTSNLRAFNISSSSFAMAKNSRPDVQIGLNFTAPISSSGDKFAWISKNAVNIFLQNTGSIPKYLASFKDSNPLTGAPPPASKVVVLQGTFDLQINAFFQKKDGLWRELFQTLGNVPGTPLLATLGIPGIAVEAMDFVAYSLNKLTQSEQLVPLWDTHPLTFALTKDSNQRFKFRPGLWTAVDSDVAKATGLLRDHRIDIAGESFQICDSSGKPLDANYVVADFSAGN